MSWFALAVWAVAGLALCVAAVEYGLRYWISTRAPVRIRNPLENLHITPDPAIFPSLPASSRFTSNIAGARGGDDPVNGRTFRALAVGGSGVECLMLDDDACWTAIVAQHLSTGSAKAALGVDHVRVWSNGCSGITTDTLIYALPDELKRYRQLDAIIIMNGASAINTWCDLELPAVMPAMEPSWIDLAFHRNHRWSWSPRHTAIAELIRRLRVLRPRPPRELKKIGRTIALARKARASTDRIIRELPDTSSWLGHYKRTLAEVVDIAGNHAKRVILVHQPIFSKTDPTAEEIAMMWHGGLGPEGQKIAFVEHDLMIEMCELLRVATKDVAEQTGATFVDPTPAIASVQANFYDHFHFTPEGARCLGVFIAERLLDGHGHHGTGSGSVADPSSEKGPLEQAGRS
ncbi:MAG: hypothetical protein R3D67_02710 [Hyphomicrobiaceae bacterium]